ncbi:MAG: ankyrin repeat domain-containing protein, partial [Alphaproteobacteria bacterium]|nr:ankyrin repeat domain-containing protein [Alphaproteobacteria bacterium]
MRNKVLALVGTKRSRLPGDSEPPFKKPNLGQTSKKRAASSPSPKSVKISKIKQEPGLPKEHTNQGEQCFLMALEYYFLKRIETHVDLSTSNVQVSYKKCTEPVKTFLEHVDDSNKSPTLQLNKLQELFNHIASTPYAEVTVVTDLEFDAEPGASLNDQLACVQNGILEELRFEESQGNHIKWNELDYPYLLDIHVDLLNILYKKRSKLPSQSTMKRYEERNHAVLVAGCEGDMIIINDPNEGRSTKKEVKVSQLRALAKQNLISIWTQRSEDTSTKPSRQPSIKLEHGEHTPPSDASGPDIIEKKQLALQKPTISLHEAIKTGNLVAVQYYIDSGTDLNTPLIETPIIGLTPLHLAAQFGHKDILETL